MQPLDPTPSLSPADIPDWDYLPEVNLADYLDAHPHQSVFRIFAGKVVLSRAIVRQTSIAAHALDLRVDCAELHLGIDPSVPGGAIKIDVSGVDNSSLPGSLVGWKSYAPATDAAQDGEAGFDGGSITINALTVTTDQTTNTLGLDLDLSGGQGGNGQQGFWGADGVAGVVGRDGADLDLQPNPDAGGMEMYYVSDPGQAGGNGGNASPGGQGGNGGAGGASGSLSLVFGGCLSTRYWEPPSYTYSVYSPSPAGFANIRVVQTPGAGGAAGEGGLAGMPGPGGPEHYVFDDNPGWTMDAPNQVSGGSDGQPASPGSPGSSGVVGATGSLALTGNDAPPVDGGGDPTGSSPRAVYMAMESDLRPNSLRYRFHQAIRAELVGLSNGSFNLTQVQGHIAWITAAAAYLQYDDVSARCAEINQATEQDLTSSPLTRATAAVPISTFEAMMARVNAAGSSAIQGRDNPTLWEQIAAGNLALITSWWTGFNAMSGQPVDGQAAKGLSDGIAEWLSSAGTPGEIEMVPLDTAAGAEATTTDATATAMADLTPDMLEAAADAGDAGIVMLGAYGGVLALQGIFGSSFGSSVDTAYEDYKASQLKWQAEYGAWQREQNARPVMDQANQQRISDESRRKKQRQPYDEYPLIDPLMGRIIAAADAVEAVDGDDTKQVVTFDGVWVPAILDNAVAAAYVAMTSRDMSIKVTTTLPSALPIVEGDWYEFIIDLSELEPAQPPLPTRTIVETYLRILSINGGYSMLGLPPLQAGALSEPTPADPAFITMLQFVLGLTLVPGPKRNTPVLAPATAQVISSVTVVNIGQGTCHTVEGSNGLRMLFDIGRDGTVAAEGTADYVHLLTWIKSGPAVVVLSHWDQDHLRLISEDAALGLTNNVWLSSSYGLGYTLTAKNTAFCVGTKSHLYLAGGDSIPMEVSVAPHVVVVSSASDLLAQAGLNVPNLALTTTQGPSGKNDCHAVSTSVVLTNAGAVTWQMLMPGDCSYRYIGAAQRTNLGALEATHHGSQRSIQNDPADAVPAIGGAGAKMVYFSNGKGNQFGHSAARVWAYYKAQGWTAASETSTAGTSFKVSIPQ